MANWFDNSFGDLSRFFVIKTERSESSGEHQSQPTNSSSDDECTITYAWNPRQACTSDMSSNGQSRPTSSSAKQHVRELKREPHKQVRTAQYRSTSVQTCSRDRTERVNESRRETPQRSKTDESKKSSNDLKRPNEGATKEPCNISNAKVIQQAGAPYVPQVARKAAERPHEFRKRFRPSANGLDQCIRPLGSITRCDRYVSVIAVVSFVNPIKQTTGTDKYLYFGLSDPTLHGKEGLKCLCFQRCLEDMPQITGVGDIVKFPCLRITVYENNIQGRNCDGEFPWITFDGRPDAPIVPRYSRCSRPAFTDADRKKIEELKSWSLSVCLTRPCYTLAALVNHQDFFFDLPCQVVHVEENILHVWDGTQPAIPGLLSKLSEELVNATKWGQKVADRCVEVLVFGGLSSKCTAGLYLLIRDLHLTKNILRLHEGIGTCERGIVILDDGDFDMKKLGRRMEELPTPPPPQPRTIPPLQPRKPPPNDLPSEIPSMAQRLNYEKLQCAHAEGQRRSYSSSGADVNRTNNVYTIAEIKNEAIATTSNQGTARAMNEASGRRTSGGVISGKLADKPLLLPTDIDDSSPVVYMTAGTSADDAGAKPVGVTPVLSAGSPAHVTTARSADDTSAKPMAVAGAGATYIVRPRDVTDEPAGIAAVSGPMDGPTSRPDNVAGKSTATTVDVDGAGPSDIAAGERPVGIATAPANFATEMPVSVTCAECAGTTSRDRSSSRHVNQAPTRQTNSFCKIAKAISGNVPGRFRCRATLRCISPHRPDQFVIYVCSPCQKRYQTNEITDGSKEADASAKEKCPNCGGPLSLSIIFTALFADDTGAIGVAFSGNVSKTFLSIEEPVKLLRDKETRDFVARRLKKLLAKKWPLEFEVERHYCVYGERNLTLFLMKELRYPAELE